VVCNAASRSRRASSMPTDSAEKVEKVVIREEAGDDEEPPFHRHFRALLIHATAIPTR